MIDVDDEIADLEIAQVGEEAFVRFALSGSAPLFLEDVGLRIELQRGVGQTEPA